jgi:hypothetical protein
LGESWPESTSKARQEGPLETSEHFKYASAWVFFEAWITHQNVGPMTNCHRDQSPVKGGLADWNLPVATLR